MSASGRIGVSRSDRTERIGSGLVRAAGAFLGAGRTGPHQRAHFFVCDDHFSASDAAELVYEHILKLHGLPRQIISDRGTQFASALFKEFCKKLGIRASMSTAYHPQTDGQTEQVNQSLEQYLWIFTEH